MSFRHSTTIEGLHCASCVKTVSFLIQKWGGTNVNVDLTSNTASFEAPHESLDSLDAALQAAGFSLRNTHDHEEHIPFKNSLIVAIALTTPLLLGMVPGLHFLHNGWLHFILSAPVLFIGLREFSRRAIASIAAKSPSMEVLILLGAISSFGLSCWNFFLGDSHVLYFESSASIITFVLLGNYLEGRALKATRSSVSSLEKVIPKIARVVNASGEVEERNTKDLVVGDVVLLGPGDITPADGEVISGEIITNESIVSGESAPLVKRVGDKLIEGSSVIQGGGTFRVTAVGQDGTLGKISSLLSEAHSNRPRIQRIGDRVSAIFTPIIIVIALATLIGHITLGGSEVEFAIITAVSVIVIACPCAMGLATPTALVVSLGESAKRGILIKNSETIEKLSKITHVFLDKTGTLTSGDLKISEYKSAVTDLDINHIAANINSLEQFSNHPVAKSLINWAETFSTTRLEVINFNEEVGRGVSGTIGGKRYEISSGDGELRDKVTFKEDGKVQLSFSLAEEIVPNASESIEILKNQMGLSVAVLSGDSATKVEQLSLPINKKIGDLTPARKVKVIEEARRDGANVLFVGDGVNDAGALAAASVGVSVSSASGLTKDASDVVILNGDAKRIPLLIEIGKHTLRIIKGNLFWAFAYNIIAVPLAATGMLSPTLAAIVMTFSDIVVVGNSLRLKSEKLYRI